MTAPHIPGTLFARNLVERRSLLFEMVRRDFDKRFVGSAMGWIWGLIHPLVMLVSWTFAFSVCMNYQLGPEEVTQHYPLFLFAGMLPWLLFSDTVLRSATSLTEHANLITKTVFPAEIVPVSVFLSGLVSHTLTLGLFIATVAIWEGKFGLALLLLPVYTLLVGMFAVGLGWIVASLQVYLRDTAQMMSVALTFWFWMTPIFLSEQQYPERLRFLLAANPVAYMVRSYRQILLSTSLPRFVFEDLGVIAVWAVVAFVAGGLFFRHMKGGFADVL